MNSTKQTIPTLVMVEDDPGHALLIERTLHRYGIENPLVHLQDGQEAIDYLFDEDSRRKPASPLVVLLDLNLPRISGFEVLERLKTDPGKWRIPVVILATTDNPDEMLRCYDLGCNAYVTKPVSFEHFGETIQTIGRFIRIMTVPNGHS